MSATVVLASVLWAAPVVSVAGKADVINVDVKPEDKNHFHFAVTVQHADEGWQHYVDRWEVTTVEGGVLATRTLYHPHVDEQPFTRSLSGVEVPVAVSEVVVRARCSIHGYGGITIRVKLPR
jgi:hypothetical protein